MSGARSLRRELPMRRRGYAGTVGRTRVWIAPGSDPTHLCLMVTREGCYFAGAAARCGFGPVHVQPWINQPLAPFFSTNVICAASRIATPFSL